MRLVAIWILLFLVVPFGSSQQVGEAPAFTLHEVMIPMRDGVHLQTVIMTPVGQQGPLPILFTRTPYGVPEKVPEPLPFYMQDLARDGYIFVFQNLRGRFKSEGVFKLSSAVDLNDPKATNETTDAYDSIEWLVKNVQNNNGKVGMMGISYAGLTTAMALLHPHPALKAISEQASPVNQWMNDDMHRYGALRESYDFEYSVYEEADKNKNTQYQFESTTLTRGTWTSAHFRTSTRSTCTVRFPSGTRRWLIRTTTSSGRRRRGWISCTPPPFPI